jgi:hypothetical protein
MHQDDNDDFCSTCGGSGELVCCDGCTCSFHFVCIDPPMAEDHETGKWYCNECMQKWFPPIGVKTGSFGLLLTALDRKNPQSFRLPRHVRDYFEGVKTTPDGDYSEETVQTRSR